MSKITKKSLLWIQNIKIIDNEMYWTLNGFNQFIDFNENKLL